jgi:hypothetical protein
VIQVRRGMELISIFGEPGTASVQPAVIDRLVHHAEVVSLCTRGPRSNPIHNEIAITRTAASSAR